MQVNIFTENLRGGHRKRWHWNFNYISLNISLRSRVDCGCVKVWYKWRKSNFFFSASLSPETLQEPPVPYTPPHREHAQLIKTDHSSSSSTQSAAPASLIPGILEMKLSVRTESLTAPAPLLCVITDAVNPPPTHTHTHSKDTTVHAPLLSALLNLYSPPPLFRTCPSYSNFLFHSISHAEFPLQPPHWADIHPLHKPALKLRSPTISLLPEPFFFSQWEKYHEFDFFKL